MCGRSLVMRRVRFGSGEARWDERGPDGLGPPVGSSRFFGLDVEGMSPRAQVATALSILASVILSGVLLVGLAPGLWWVFTTYGWVAFPAFGLLVRGFAGLPEGRTATPARERKERELLGALRQWGELTPTRAAMETSLSVAEADEMLRELAEGGHLEVRVRRGAIFYALWTRPAALEAEDRETQAGTLDG